MAANFPSGYGSPKTLWLVSTIYMLNLIIIMSHHHVGGWGNIVFSADPVGVGVVTCLHSISLLNGQILAKLTQMYHWEGEKC